jgi:2-desacetyl-2-hydroxyethyl bacteriochlorophyllide A dehydrogenase
MKHTAIIFKNPYDIELREEPLPPLNADDVLIRAKMSAISSGSEMLVYRGQLPSDLPVDITIKALSQNFSYPLKYGYASIGKIVEIGSQVNKIWLDQTVFCFHPHESHYVTAVDQVTPVPTDIDPLDALFLPNMESAVNFLMDGRPVIGEYVVVFGQGVVGLLTTALLARYPLGALVTVDNFSMRRRKSLEVGAHNSFDSSSHEVEHKLATALKSGFNKNTADLVYEISGNPDALNQAMAVAGFGARIVIGSWYGTKKNRLDLGGRFHRSRIRLVSSQVSTLAPEFSGRWDNVRRVNLAWEMIRRLKPTHLITHRIHYQRVQEAYELLDKRPHEAIQIILTYD